MKKFGLKISLFSFLFLFFCGKNVHAVIGNYCDNSKPCIPPATFSRAETCNTYFSICLPQSCDPTSGTPELSSCVHPFFICTMSSGIYSCGIDPNNPGSENWLNDWIAYVNSGGTGTPPSTCQSVYDGPCNSSTIPCCADMKDPMTGVQANPPVQCVKSSPGDPYGKCFIPTAGEAGLPNLDTCVPLSDFHLDCSKYTENIAEPCSNGAVLYLFCPIVRGLNILLYAVGSILVILILYGAIKAVTSTGDPKQLEGAKMVWTYAIFGFAVIVFSIALVLILLKLFGVTTFNPFKDTERLLETMLMDFYHNLYSN